MAGAPILRHQILPPQLFFPTFSNPTLFYPTMILPHHDFTQALTLPPPSKKILLGDLMIFDTENHAKIIILVAGFMDGKPKLA